MFFPGGIYVAGAFFALVGLCFTGALACLIGVGGLRVSELLIHRTQTWRDQRKGMKNKDRWWMSHHSWGGGTFVATWALLIYTVAGPYVALLKLLSGATLC